MSRIAQAERAASGASPSVVTDIVGGAHPVTWLHL
ncbi:hypothetical protein J2W51_006076 [Tardiphaga robiniae]|nr:hypothetical protein [Tardiphaga robiniae]